MDILTAQTFVLTVGNAIQTLKVSDAVKVITVRGTAFEAAATSGGSGSTEAGLQTNTVVNLLKCTFF